jgi:L-alanine-DL-glutamate epimerase-like enolase superfamily enzyme
MSPLTTTIATRRIALDEPQLTPRGTFSEVWSTDLALHGVGATATGRARSMDEARAAEAAHALRRLCEDDEVRGAVAALPSAADPLGQWRRTWLDLEDRCGPGAELKALCALDEAVWDLARQLDRRPVGAAPPPPLVGAYWSGLWQHSTPAELAEEARWAAGQGFDAAKMRLDGTAVGASVDRIRTVLAAAPPGRWLGLELAHSGSPHHVAEIVEGVDRTRILWVEDPLPLGHTEETAALVQELGVPVALGEDCWERAAWTDLVHTTAAQVPIVDLGHLGGPTAMQLVLEDPAFADTEIGVHIDALTGADVVACSAHPGRIWLEVYPWWGLPDLAEVRRRAEAFSS